MTVAVRSGRRILFISASLEGGGAERQIVALANYWARRGDEVVLLTFTGPQVPDAYAIDAHVRREHLDLPSRAGRLNGLRFIITCVRRLRRFMKNLRADIIVSFISSTNVLTLLASRGLPVRVIVSERVHPGVDVTLSAVFRHLRGWTYRLADVVVAQTTDAADWIRSRLHARAVVIPNVLRELPVHEVPRERIVLSIGRLARQKGFDLLLRAFAAVADRFPGWNLVILGDGPERAELLALRDSLRLGERVTLPGHTREIEKWMARAGLVVQPSRFEGFPNVVLEAMGMGAAVISSDCKAGPADLIRDGVNGRLVPVEDVAALANCMADLLQREDLRAKLGSEATKVRGVHSESRIMQLWQAAFQVPAHA